MRFYSLISSLILSVFLLFLSGSESVRTLKRLTVRSGGSLSVPCLYEEKYKSDIKYWCTLFKSIFGNSCGTTTYANTSNTGISVTDHPSQNICAMDLNNLQDSDSGNYWCGMEIDGQDDGDSVYLTVSEDPVVWVEDTRVIGQEGGGVSVQGFYSSEYNDKEKKWCRFGVWSCYYVGRTKTSQSLEVLISDYSQGSFRVEMFGLQKSDAGWYWFSAGLVGVTVHLTVTERPTMETLTSSSRKDTKTSTQTVETRNTLVKTTLPYSEKPMESVEFCIAQN
ncbi:polymeric immunoglobulin receptor-like isoform X1 [Astyanax mexicanus]|uniref:polymeric immunoglobulin receptor-like isoform X1 n=1 Tax=Astyanax mexicanus TaxID=7994 RepID=UPI0020CB06EF|nr:polymeric immunoglobulin receptor-like isoform X1 [Astyanax mexicanus]